MAWLRSRRLSRAELARLRAENTRLLRLLKLTPQQAVPPGPVQAAYFEAPPGLVDDGSPPEAKMAFYAALFAARTDVYATRFDNPRTAGRYHNRLKYREPEGNSGPVLTSVAKSASC